VERDIVGIGERGGIYIYDLITGVIKDVKIKTYDGYPNHIAPSPTSIQWFISDSTIIFRNIGERSILWTDILGGSIHELGKYVDSSDIWDFRINKKGTYIIVDRRPMDGAILQEFLIIDVSSRKIVKWLPGPFHFSTFSPDGNHIIMIKKENVIQYDIESSKLDTLYTKAETDETTVEEAYYIGGDHLLLLKKDKEKYEQGRKRNKSLYYSYYIYNYKLKTTNLLINGDMERQSIDVFSK
jgi:hypothetical protein